MMHEIENYIKRRYERWLDYAAYHCTHAGISQEAGDVLNEVLCSLLQKDEEKLTKLLHSKSGQYTELDFFVLRMIKINATSTTSPYYYKYAERIQKDDKADVSKMEITDTSTKEEDDRSLVVLEQMRKVRAVLEELQIDEFAKKVFEHRFFLGESFESFRSTRNKSKLYEIYGKVAQIVKAKINNNIAF